MLNQKYVSILLIILFICLIIMVCECNQNNNENNKTSDNKVAKYDENLAIIINDELFEKMVNIVTDYSLKFDKKNEKLGVIYLVTFHLFDMNYSVDSLRQLDAQLENHPYVPCHIKFPKGNMHNNIQKVIITGISTNIVKSDENLVGDKDKDIRIIRPYLRNTFRMMGIMKENRMNYKIDQNNIINE